MESPGIPAFVLCLSFFIFFFVFFFVFSSRAMFFTALLPLASLRTLMSSFERMHYGVWGYINTGFLECGSAKVTFSQLISLHSP